MKAGMNREGKNCWKKGEYKMGGGVKNKKGENGSEGKARWGCGHDNDEL